MPRAVFRFWRRSRRSAAAAARAHSNAEDCQFNWHRSDLPSSNGEDTRLISEKRGFDFLREDLGRHVPRVASWPCKSAVKGSIPFLSNHLSRQRERDEAAFVTQG